MKYIYAIISLLFIASNLFGQERSVYSRVEIPINDNWLFKAKALGIDSDHGYRTAENNYVVEISEVSIDLLRKNNIPFKVTIPDLTTYYINRSKVQTLDIRNNNTCFPLPVIDTPLHFKLGSMLGFYTYEEFLNQLDSMRILFPNLISAYQPISDFKTYDNNPIYWLKISDNPNSLEAEPKVLYTALHHAREPMSLTSLIYYMWYVLENYGKNEEITALVNSSELYFIPMINPDGYRFNQLTDPLGGGMWRKNTKPNGPAFFGTDLNRNYSKFWGFDEVGSSSYGDADTYRGASAFSEVENQAVKYFCETYPFDIALNFHSYGNLVIYPWGYDGSHCPDSTSFDNVAEQFIEHNKFTGGTTSESVGYLTNGCSDDWMYGETNSHNSILSFTPEVGNEYDAFWPTEDRIVPLAYSALEMNIDALRYLHNFIKAEYIGLPALAKVDQSIDLNVTQLGKRPEVNTITISEKDNKMIFTNPVSSILLLSNEELLLNFPFAWNNVKSGDKLELYIKVSDNLLEKIDTINLEYYDVKELIFQDDCNELSNWNNSGTWGLSTNSFISPGASFSDSPDGNYIKNTVSGISTKEVFSVQPEFIKTYLNYNAKWAFEKFYDFAAVYALTTEDSTRHYLCSKNSRQGSEWQLLDEPVYESNSIKWEREVLDISDLNGNPFSINFMSDVDGYDERDGIYIDDIAITAFRHLTTSEKNIVSEGLEVYPNPVSSTLNIKADYSISTVVITDLLGRNIKYLKGNSENQMNISLTDQFKPGAYLLRIQSDTGKTSITKFVVSIR